MLGKLAIGVLSAVSLMGCTSSATTQFHVSARQMSEAWSKVVGRDMARFGEQGVEPLMNPTPRFSNARCRWVAARKEAFCRYRKLRQPNGGTWEDTESRLVQDQNGWDFGY